MICQRGVRLPAPTAPGLKMRPMQRPAAGGGAFPDARGRRRPPARFSCLPAPLTWRLRRVAYAAGRSRPPCRWGDPFRAVAQRPARCRWPDPWPGGPRASVGASATPGSPAGAPSSHPPSAIASRLPTTYGKSSEVVKSMRSRLRAGVCAADCSGLPERPPFPVSLPDSPGDRRPLDALPVRLPIRAALQRIGQGRSGSSNRSARLAGLRSAFIP